MRRKSKIDIVGESSATTDYKSSARKYSSMHTVYEMWINGGKGGRSIVDLVWGSRKRSSYAYGGGAFFVGACRDELSNGWTDQKSSPAF